MYNFRLFDAVTGADQCDAKNAGVQNIMDFIFSHHFNTLKDLSLQLKEQYHKRIVNHLSTTVNNGQETCRFCF